MSAGPTPSIYRSQNTSLKRTQNPEGERTLPLLLFARKFPMASSSTPVMSRGFTRPRDPLGFYADLNRKPTQGNALSVCRPDSQDAFSRVPWLEQNKGLAPQMPLDPETKVPSPPLSAPPPPPGKNTTCFPQTSTSGRSIVLDATRGQSRGTHPSSDLRLRSRLCFSSPA